MAVLLAFVAGAVIAIIVLHVTSGMSRKKIAGARPLPGPKGLPLIGNVHELPARNIWMKFHEWGRQYGPIYQVNLAGENHVWISSDRIAHDLLTKRSAIYSDRPFIPALEFDNRTSGQYLPLMSRNARWTRQRKFAKQIMDKSQSEAFFGYPELESVRLLFELMSNPSHYNHAMESFIARVTSRLAWGTSAPADELKQRARELLIGVSPTGALGNKLPAVMHMPAKLSPSKAWELRRGRTEKSFFETMQTDVANEMAQAEASPLPSAPGAQPKQSWTRMFLEAKNLWGFGCDLEGAYAVGMHGIAGALTIAAPMQSFCLAMCHYPQYRDVLYEEIDRVLGDRMPRFSDMPDMPVLRAFIRETLRWRPPVPTGIPHASTQDDVYEGHFIPAGSVMHPLEWSISRDPVVFPDPDAWNPMRWLDSSYPTYQEPLAKYPTITEYSQFGYGRRTCQGMGVTEADLFVGLGSVAWLFSIEADGEAEVATPDLSPVTERKDSAVPTPEKSPVTKACEIPPGTQTPPNEEEIKAQLDGKRVRSTEKKHQDVPVDGYEVPRIPGSYPAEPKTLAKPKVPPKSIDSIAEEDPTMNFSTLLIAKPMPFKFQLKIRNTERGKQVAQRWVDLKTKGEFDDARVYWKDGDRFTTNGNAECGWGAVFS